MSLFLGVKAFGINNKGSLETQTLFENIVSYLFREFGILSVDKR